MGILQAVRSARLWMTTRINATLDPDCVQSDLDLLFIGKDVTVGPRRTVLREPFKLPSEKEG